MKTNDVKGLFTALPLDDEQNAYLQFHAGRYAYLSDVLEQIRAVIPGKSIRILDIGPSFFTTLLCKIFPGDSISTLGYDAGETVSGHLPAPINPSDKVFYRFNLNDAQHRDRWIEVPPLELIVMAEVVEHLYTAPSLVLAFIRSILAPGGYLVIQTPNAAYWMNRVRMLLGRNPFDLIRENDKNPGHYREYTRSELVGIAKECGFTVKSCRYVNYFHHKGFKGMLNDLVQKVLPGPFKCGMTLVLRAQ